MKANITLSLYRLTVLALLALLRNVHAKLTGNINFATPAVPLIDMEKQADKLEAAIEEATKGSREARVLRDIEVDKTREMLRVQANYIRTVAAGDVAKLSTCGFDLSKTPAPIGLPKAPLIKLVRMSGEKGQVELSWTSDRGADSFNVLMTQKDPASGAPEWEIVGSTTRTRFTQTGLLSLTPYWFAVRAVGAAGQSVMSQPAMGVAA